MLQISKFYVEAFKFKDLFFGISTFFYFKLVFHSKQRFQDINNIIGADTISQILIELIRFTHSLDQNLTDTICTYIRTKRIIKIFHHTCFSRQYKC